MWISNYICLDPTCWEIQKHQGWVSEIKPCQIFATLFKPNENSGTYHRNGWKRLKYSIYTTLQKAFLTQTELHCLRFPHKWFFGYRLLEKCLWKHNWHHTHNDLRKTLKIQIIAQAKNSKCQRHLCGWIKTWRSQNFLSELLIITYLLKSKTGTRFPQSPGQWTEWLKGCFSPCD